MKNVLMTCLNYGSIPIVWSSALENITYSLWGIARLALLCLPSHDMWIYFHNVDMDPYVAISTHSTRQLLVSIHIHAIFLNVSWSVVVPNPGRGFGRRCNRGSRSGGLPLSWRWSSRFFLKRINWSCFRLIPLEDKSEVESPRSHLFQLL